jgi:hypothetical protein
VEADYLKALILTFSCRQGGKSQKISPSGMPNRGLKFEPVNLWVQIKTAK